MKVKGTLLLLVCGLMLSGPTFAKKPHDEGLPPGLQKKAARGEPLPPGWQKKLRRGEVVDAQVYNQAAPVSNAIRLKLPAGPAGSIDVTVDGKILRVDPVTRKLLDILKPPF